MRTFMAAAALLLAPNAMADAQTAPVTPTATPTGHYTTTTTEIGTLLDDPAAKAVVEKHIPGMTTNEQIDMARGMTLKDIQQYSPDKITDKVLADVDTDLAKLAVKPSTSTK